MDANHHLHHSADWDDHLVIERSLAITESDDALAAGSAGCVALYLALNGARSVVAIHPNPATIALCQLKVAAIGRCSLSRFRTLLGVEPDGKETPATAYHAICDDLPVSLREYWNARPNDIAVGLLGCGAYERTHRVFRERLARVASATAAVAGLFELQTIAEQAEYLERVVLSEGFMEAYRETFSWEAAVASGEITPHMMRYEEDRERYSNRFLTMMRRTLARTPARENFYLRFFLTGTFGDPQLGPPYLRPQEFARLKDRVDRIRFVCGDVAEQLAAAQSSSLDKIFFVGMTAYSDDYRDRVIGELARVLRDHGRWCGNEHRLAGPRGPRGRLRPLQLANELAGLERFPRAGLRRVEIQSV